MLNLGGVLVLMLLRVCILFGEVEGMVVAGVGVMFFAYCFC